MGKYFTINRARQYGKTTTLIALKHFLEKEYYVVLIDFQSFGSADFESENVFALSFANSFLRFFKKKYEYLILFYMLLQQLLEDYIFHYCLVKVF